MGLFVPLMDNDAAHHANIALRMYQTGDYVNLIDAGTDYLDKPHLHFWLCALSYHVFGVNSFAYKLPSFLFTLLAVYSTYRLGKSLYNKDTGKLSALILASSFAFILSNNDVRMDAILLGCIAFSTWQLVDFIQQKRTINITGAAAGLALGFCAKGHVGVLVPAVSAFFYMLYLKKWSLFYHWKWLLLIGIFSLLILPEVYCYYLQYNLHPEKKVRGRDHINGVRFILLDQALSRYSGEMSPDDSRDWLFVIYTFLWAFAPWSILCFVALVSRIKNLITRKEEWLTTGTFIVLLIIITITGSKLPHYLNIVFPVASVMTASFITQKEQQASFIRNMKIYAVLAVMIILVAASIFNVLIFPVNNLWLLFILTLILFCGYYFIFSGVFTPMQKSIITPVWSMILLFYLLNGNFYPQLLKWQAGKELATAVKGKIDPKNIYFWENTYSSSFNFYTQQLRQSFDSGSVFLNDTTWIVYDRSLDTVIRQKGYIIDSVISVPDFEITKLTIKFLNSATRLSQCTEMRIGKVRGKTTVSSNN